MDYLQTIGAKYGYVVKVSDVMVIYGPGWYTLT